MRLADIPKSLGFKEMAQKEVMYYNMYNYKTIDHISKMTKGEINKCIEEFNKPSHLTKRERKDKENNSREKDRKR